MPFSSPTFLFLFLPALLLVYHLVGFAPLPSRFRTIALNLILFAGSVLFYSWGEEFTPNLLLYSMVGNFALGFVAAKWPRAGAILAVILNLAILIYYKYAGFLVANFSFGSLAVSAPHLPLALSFFTFQAMSYVLDVSRGQVPPERSLLRFGVYVFLFPHLIAGPIVRYADLAATLKNRTVGLDRFAEGVRRFAIGLGKKLLLANSFAIVADKVFGTTAVPVSPAHLAASAAWLGLLCYTLQIYFDFSGYSDMAIGLGKMFGFEFHENFRHPYIAQSITEFWRRWHISLSSWFRDYLYIPLGGNRGSPFATYRNLLIVFALCGLWHGASWSFLIWGLIHGLFLVIERLGFGAILAKFPRPLRHAYTLFAVMLGWVFFRVESSGQAWGLLKALFGQTPGERNAVDLWIPMLALTLPIGLLACLPIVPYCQARRPHWATRYGVGWATLFESLVLLLEIVAVAALLIGASLEIVAGTHTPFIYFRF